MISHACPFKFNYLSIAPRKHEATPVLYAGEQPLAFLNRPTNRVPKCGTLTTVGNYAAQRQLDYQLAEDGSVSRRASMETDREVVSQKRR